MNLVNPTLDLIRRDSNFPRRFVSSVTDIDRLHMSLCLGIFYSLLPEVFYAVVRHTSVIRIHPNSQVMSTLWKGHNNSTTKAEAMTWLLYFLYRSDSAYPSI